MKNPIESISLALLLTAPSPATVAGNSGPVNGEPGTDRVVDVAVMRPLGLAAAVMGAALTVVALPFTIPGGSVEASAREPIVKPAEYTFKRSLGDFSGDDE